MKNFKNFISIATSDHEQEEQVKDWLKNYWIYIVLGLALGLGGIFSINYYKDYQVQQSKQARDIYLQLVNVDNYNDGLEFYNQLMEDHSDSFYFSGAELLLVKYAIKDKKFNIAISYLTSLLTNDNKEISQVAKYKLASVYTMQEKYDQALQILNTEYNLDNIIEFNDYFQVITNNMKGDIYYLTKKFNLAKQEYQAILNNKNINNNEFKNLVKIKLANIP